ncbi:MAG TPA: class F sortase [Gaiellaceae bacterium]|nr:class F sortase [Gaiellaceae bacterium]
MATLIGVPALWLAGCSDAAAGSPAAIGALPDGSGGVNQGDELRELAPRAVRGGPPPVKTRSARLVDLPRAAKRRPTSLRIAALGLVAPVRPVGVVDGLVEVPGDAGLVGWYRHGASPGEPGSAVLVGHVDLDGRRGVFFRLRDLQPGAVVTVGFARGDARSFRVVARRSYPKGRLPAQVVFAESGPPYLTLVTCGGDFDAARGEYEENVVVLATLVGQAPEKRAVAR